MSSMRTCCVLCWAVAKEKEDILAASKAIVNAPKASMTALCKSKAVTLGDQKILAAVRKLDLSGVAAFFSSFGRWRVHLFVMKNVALSADRCVCLWVSSPRV